MARRRMIETSLSHDKVFNALPEFCQLLYLKVLPHTDDYGRFEGDPEVLKARVDPLSKKSVAKYSEAIKTIAESGLWVWYKTQEGRMVIEFKSGAFNRINAFLIKNRKKEGIDEYPAFTEGMVSLIDMKSYPYDMLAYHIESKRIKDKGKEIKDTANESIFSFEALWSRYPRRDGKKEALKHYTATVTTPELEVKIDLALNAYLTYLRKHKTEPKFIKMGSTWFNNWQDWIPQEQAPKPVRSYAPVLIDCSGCGKVHTMNEDCPKPENKVGQGIDFEKKEPLIDPMKLVNDLSKGFKL